MKSTGIARGVDELGRITLPIELRRSLEVMEKRAKLELLESGPYIIIKKPGESPMGIVRRLDELGRITLPIEHRRSFHISEGDKLEIFVEEGQVLLAPQKRKDVFTGMPLDGNERSIVYCGYAVSYESIVEMAKLAGLEVIEQE